MGLEPTTISLATRCSTTELRPLGCMRLIYTTSEKSQARFEKKMKKECFLFENTFSVRQRQRKSLTKDKTMLY